MHGHHGIEIIFITQRPAKLNADVLSSVTTHYVLRRKFGFDAAIIWEFGEAITTWSRTTATYALNRTLWKYPKHLYKFYVSSENHQVKKTFPTKYLGLAAIPIALFAYGLLKANETGFFGFFNKEKQETAQVQTNTQTAQPNATGSIICTYDNIHTKECQDLQKIKNSQLNKEIQSNTVQYNLNDPYLTLTPARVELDIDASQLPRLSGCIKYQNKYYGIDQQGNRMPNVKQEACRRWIEDSARPYNYFAESSNNYKKQDDSAMQIVKNDGTSSIQNVAQHAITTPVPN